MESETEFWYGFCLSVSLDSCDGREICFIVIQVYNGIQHHHNALFFNGFDAMLSNIGHGGGMADYSGWLFNNHHGQFFKDGGWKWWIFGFFCHTLLITLLYFDVVLSFDIHSIKLLITLLYAMIEVFLDLNTM